MGLDTYVPKYGDIVYLTFDPSLGHEQKGRRPALVVSSDKFIRNSKLCIVCPISNTNNNFPLHIGNIKHLGCEKIEGYVLTEHIKSINYFARNLEFVEKAPDYLLAKVMNYISSFFGEI